jgi:hypothetical protein
MGREPKGDDWKTSVSPRGPFRTPCVHRSRKRITPRSALTILVHVVAWAVCVTMLTKFVT